MNLLLMLNNFCSSSQGLRLLGFLGKIYVIFKFLVPIILIVVGSFDLLRAIINTDDISKSTKLLIKKCIYAVLIFFLFSGVSFLLYLVGSDKDTMLCLSCFKNPDECLKKADDIKNEKCLASLDKNNCCTENGKYPHYKWDENLKICRNIELD